MKLGVRHSPHLENLLAGIDAVGEDQTTTYFNSGCDFWLAWGWPQAEEIAKHGAPTDRIIALDAHPYALQAGDKSGDRIFQLGNWGAMARYPEGTVAVPDVPDRSNPTGPVLVLGQVRSTEQIRNGFVDVWHTPGFDQWTRSELAKPGRKFREHPREWARLRGGMQQPTLAEDLRGCSRVVGWNSTALVHCRRLGYPVEGFEAHAWNKLSDARLQALRLSPSALRCGSAWDSYRSWLIDL